MLIVPLLVSGTKKEPPPPEGCSTPLLTMEAPPVPTPIPLPTVYVAAVPILMRVPPDRVTPVDDPIVPPALTFTVRPLTTMPPRADGVNVPTFTAPEPESVLLLPRMIVVA